MSQAVTPIDSRIVMAEQNGHDVVNQTLSGGDPSPSGVPASTTDKKPAGEDEGEINITATASSEPKSKVESDYQKIDTIPPAGNSDKGQDGDQVLTDESKQVLGSVATRALEMNGVMSTSDGGDDTASQGGSESDASRTESKVHSRAGSVKRPTAFKPVSFAKFSVPKAPGTPPVTKTSEKVPLSSATPLSTTVQNPRPRLVAKTTSSLRDSLSKTGTSSARLTGAGPDPNQVWNRNRPVQQTPPKHLTDEELKQQYGIHMTSRIQEDGGGTESKWADIDDDEDDWAPETIEWNDGTKTDLKADLPHTEPIPANQQTTTKTVVETKEEPAVPEQVTTAREAPKHTSKPVTSIGPNPTVLRLGASAERQARTASISSKGPNERPPSSSTSPAPPAKSPWAPIPPVEKVSPVMPPVQAQPLARTSFKETKPNDSAGAPVAPKEIAADDFNRSWKDTQPGTRELYNSRSGRYEPVPEPRKGTWRNEQNLRAPSVLQRPAAQGENIGPAEPSAAFQTHRTSGQDGAHWNRRRTSSNVSGGSGSFGRRMSIGRHDAVQRSFEARRGSQANGMIESFVQPREHPSKEIQMRDASPLRQGPSPYWPPGEPANGPEMVAPAAANSAHPAAPPPPDRQHAVPQAPQEDAVAMQERIMKEKRLEARQRRLEQEEKEEAAKRERIRQKLEALGPAPEKPKAKHKESPETRAATTTTGHAQSPPKPPVPEPTGAPKQYGMMKVHHPDTVKRLIEKERSQEKPNIVAGTRRPSAPNREPKADSPTTNGSPPLHEHPEHVGDKVAEKPTGEQSPQWTGNLNVPNTYSPWTANSKLVGASAPITNPWKPLSNDKTLGNGIFDQSLGNFPARDMNLRNHLGLDQPPLPPSSQPFPATSRSAQESTTISPLPSPETRHASYDPLSPIARPGPIGPPRAQHPHWQHEARTAAWNDFHAVATKREAEENEKLQNEMNAARETQSSLQVTFNETWRQVRTGDQAGQRQVVGVSRSTDGTPPMPNPLSGLEHPVGPLPFAEAHARPLGSVPIRSSRFFPQATETRKLALEEDYFRSPSPPPPEEVSTHPVYFGDSNRPLVHLPQPKPIVKLPPKIVAPPPPPPTFASMVASNTRSGPPSTATSWQEKINTLFGKKTAILEKKNALAVSSASKEPLDVQLHIAAVSVSLPYNGETQAGDGELTAKQVEEAEAMFEDREVGSLPVVRVPTMAPPAAWRAAPAPSQARLRSKALKSMQVHSVEPFPFGLYDKDTSPVTRISIRLPGSDASKTLTVSRKAGSHTSNPRSRGPSTFKPRKNVKQREDSNNSSFKKTPSNQANGSSPPQRQSRKASWDTPTSGASR
ncbi:uncharacterized protein BJX67DRAFT_355718 [Aspergillus lucknowensis]|uniref:Uncharacterized protein n=1 Tax=Aspergillus lucknowensis TaxID=176173 RepID=A0ABR4LPG5_9EURO